MLSIYREAEIILPFKLFLLIDFELERKKMNESIDWILIFIKKRHPFIGQV